MKLNKLVYSDIINKEKLTEALKYARKNKRSNRKDLVEFFNKKDENINLLFEELKNKTYKPRPYNKFILKDKKPRRIYAPTFRDSIVQQLLYRELYPRINRYLVKMNVGCRVGHGLKSNMRYIKKEINKYSEEDYYIHFDIRKFFYSLKHEIILNKLKKITKDIDILSLIANFLPCEKGDIMGIPIGNLLSQLIGLFILNDLDHMIKRELKIRSYIRYVDDFLLIGIKKEDINSIKNRVITFLDENLELELSKAFTNKIKHGINFCGYRVFQDKVLARKKNLRKFVLNLKNGNTEAIVSMLEYSKNTSSYKFYRKLLIDYSKKYAIIIPENVSKKLNVNYINIGKYDDKGENNVK